MATLSSVLAWRTPGMGEPGGLPSLGLHRVGYDWCDLAAASNHLEKDMTTHFSILAWRIPWTGSLVGYSPWGSQKVRHNWATKQQQSNHYQDPEIGHFQPLRGSHLWCKGHCVLSRFMQLFICSLLLCLSSSPALPLPGIPTADAWMFPVCETQSPRAVHLWTALLRRRSTPTGRRSKSVTTPRY